jgi:four helix bundle protein
MKNIDALYFRFVRFTHCVIQFTQLLPKSTISEVVTKQLLRSSSSVGANFAESLEALTSKDRGSKINISRKELKESIYWLDVISLEYPNLDISSVKSEGIELAKILATIQRKIQNSLDA